MNSSTKYQGPAKPVPTYRDPFPDAWLAIGFAVMFAALMFIFYMGW